MHLCPVFCIGDFLAPEDSEEDSLKMSTVVDSFGILCIRKSFSRLTAVEYRI